MSCERRRLRVIGSTAVEAARAALHAELTTDHTGPDSCLCAKCRDHPLTATEADAALEHVSDADAQLYAAGALRFTSFEMCDQCGAWMPVFVDSQPCDHGHPGARPLDSQKSTSTAARPGMRCASTSAVTGRPRPRT